MAVFLPVVSVSSKTITITSAYSGNIWEAISAISMIKHKFSSLYSEHLSERLKFFVEIFTLLFVIISSKLLDSSAVATLRHAQ